MIVELHIFGKLLNKAIKEKELRLYYQPKLDLKSGKIIGVEALVRWEHPEKGMIPPLDFIPFAEESGMILAIGEWVLRSACEQNKAWQEKGLPHMVMAVNLSAKQFFQPDLVNKIQSILNETELAPEYLELEITESMMMDVSTVLPILRELKRIGLRISLDDFGTGYSSLFYLKEFPIDIIKIDKSFVRNCTLDTKDATIVKAIIAMSHQLKMEVVAEGIETKDQLIFLQQHLCNRGQGYFFSKPVLPQELVHQFNEIEQLLKNEGIPQEISRQKWLEEELELTRQELRETIRLQQGMIFKFTERNGKFIHTLCDGELLYRIGLSPEKLMSRELYDVLPVDEAERKLQYYRRAWQGEENVVYEGKLNEVWYLASLRPIRRGGQVIEVIVSCVDITERKMAEQALAESEQQYRRLVELSPEPIVVHQKGVIQFANPAFVQLLRANNLNELIGRRVIDFSPSDYRNLVEQRILKLTHEGILVNPTEEKINCLDGTVIDVEVTGISINYNGNPSYLMMVHDVTSRKQSEEALRLSEEKYRLIADNMQDLIGVLDIDGVVQYASPSHTTVLGFLPEEYEGNLAFNMVHSDDVYQIQQQYANMVLTKKPCYVQFRYKHAKGNWVYVEANGTPVIDEKGEVKQFVVVARDISERKKAEEIIRKSERLSIVGQLAAGVAHEIRNPLTSIKGFVQLIQKDVNKPFYTNVILTEVERLEGIIKGFLSFSKSQPPHWEKINLLKLLQEVVRLFDTQAILKNVKIEQENEVDLPTIFCDGNQIKQVFMNILQNAVEAMPNGGFINVQIFRESHGSIITRFIDQGYGISEERMKKIGEPYFTTKEKGTGLGLMLSQKIVQEHGGVIRFASKDGQGTMVEVILPV